MAEAEAEAERSPRDGRSRVNDPERTRADILRVATEHFAQNGLSGARVDEIAEQTHTSKRMLYYYFGSKEGLYRAVLERAYEGIRSYEVAAHLERLPPRAALAMLVERTFDYHNDNPDFVRLVMVENIHRGEHIGHVRGLDTRASSVIGLIGGLLARGVASGEFRRGIDPLDLHMTMSALAFYNVSNRYTFSSVFKHDMADPTINAARRRSVVETVLRLVCVDP